VLGVSELPSNPTIVGCAYDFGGFKPESSDFLHMQNGRTKPNNAIGYCLIRLAFHLGDDAGNVG